MGISNILYPLFLKDLEEIQKPLRECNLIELGIQENIQTGNFIRNELKDSFKQYLSLDLHEIDGVTKCDLSQYDPEKYNCDIITNFGTSEHVEYEDGQYNCWLNIHSWLKVGGISIHEIPKINNWSGHCRYYCDFSFFQKFQNFGYSIIKLQDNYYQSNGSLVYCVLKKIEDVNFMDKKSFFESIIIDNNINLSSINKLNNPKNLM
jgi:hypothetical protein